MIIEVLFLLFFSFDFESAELNAVNCVVKARKMKFQHSMQKWLTFKRIVLSANMQHFWWYFLNRLNYETHCFSMDAKCRIYHSGGLFHFIFFCVTKAILWFPCKTKNLLWFSHFALAHIEFMRNVNIADSTNFLYRKRLMKKYSNKGSFNIKFIL